MTKYFCNTRPHQNIPASKLVGKSTTKDLIEAKFGAKSTPIL